MKDKIISIWITIKFISGKIFGFLKLPILIIAISFWAGFGLYLGFKTAYNFDIVTFKTPIIISVITFDGDSDE